MPSAGGAATVTRIALHITITSALAGGVLSWMMPPKSRRIYKRCGGIIKGCQLAVVRRLSPAHRLQSVLRL